MDDLIQRLEAAESGSSMLDRAVCEALILPDMRNRVVGHGQFDANRHARLQALVSRPTQLVDAALALAERVLPGARWVMIQQGAGWGVMPLLFDGAAWECPNDPGETVARTLPLALSAAILKAARTQKGES